MNKVEKKADGDLKAGRPSRTDHGATKARKA
jgi:hypothetical protein